jgi:uncharacterized protein (DUF2141 family)
MMDSKINTMYNARYLIGTFIVLSLIIVSCATPTMPTGGPRDKTGPTVIQQQPQSGTTNFSGDRVYFEFSEFVRRESIREALSIQPSLDLEYSLKWKRKGVYVVFDEPLPEETTIIVTLGTDLTDVNGNAMESPVSIAFSTGSTISENAITGTVMRMGTGSGSKGERVFLYREGMEFSDPAYYVAQTDSAGTFRFEYLSQGTYSLFWVNDRNNNRRWEQQRERAQPFSELSLSVRNDSTFEAGRIYVQQPDTVKPLLQGVGLLSSQRLRLRFSEPIQLSDSLRMSIATDSGKTIGSARPLYIQPKDSTILFAQAQVPTQSDSNYVLRLTHLMDRAGNLQREQEYSFVGSGQEDTTQQRMVTTNTGSGIVDTTAVEAIYAKPISSSTLVDSLIVISGTDISAQWPGVAADFNTLLVLPQPVWNPEAQPQVRFWNPSIQDRTSITPTVWKTQNLAGLEWQLQGDLPVDSVHIMLETQEVIPRVVLDGSRPIRGTITGLRPITYSMTIYIDQNGNNRWDPGTVIPFTPPEPLWIQRNISLSQSMTGTVRYQFDLYTE